MGEKTAGAALSHLILSGLTGFHSCTCRGLGWGGRGQGTEGGRGEGWRGGWERGTAGAALSGPILSVLGIELSRETRVGWPC